MSLKRHTKMTDAVSYARYMSVAEDMKAQQPVVIEVRRPIADDFYSGHPEDFQDYKWTLIARFCGGYMEYPQKHEP